MQANILIGQDPDDKNKSKGDQMMATKKIAKGPKKKGLGGGSKTGGGLGGKKPRTYAAQSATQDVELGGGSKTGGGLGGKKPRTYAAPSATKNKGLGGGPKTSGGLGKKAPAGSRKK